MSRTCLTTAVLIVATAARASAAPIPLLEMTWKQSDVELGPVPATVDFVFFAVRDEFGSSYLGWTAKLGTSDVGQSFWATPDVVEGANAALKDPNAGYALGNGPGNFVGNFNLPLHEEPSSKELCFGSGLCFRIFVNDVASQTVTAVERVINYLGLVELKPDEPPGRTGNWAVSASQTIRYWGVAVPEPGSVVLLLIGVAHLCFSPRPRRRS